MRKSFEPIWNQTQKISGQILLGVKVKKKGHLYHFEIESDLQTPVSSIFDELEVFYFRSG